MSSKKYRYKFLSKLASYRVPSGFNSQVAESFFTALDCPRALTCWLMFKYNEHDQLAKLEFNPANYSNMVSCRDAYAATKFLSKFKDLSLNNDLDEVALRSSRNLNFFAKAQIIVFATYHVILNMWVTSCYCTMQ
jgi:hypothetical protein